MSAYISLFWYRWQNILVLLLYIQMNSTTPTVLPDNHTQYFSQFNSEYGLYKGMFMLVMKIAKTDNKNEEMINVTTTSGLLPKIRKQVNFVEYIDGIMLNAQYEKDAKQIDIDFNGNEYIKPNETIVREVTSKEMMERLMGRY
jgi:hypothetical protein